MKKILLFILIVFSLKAFSQVTYITENDKYCIWQPGVKLTFEMFENTNPDTTSVRIMKDENRHLMPFFGFWHIVDVPIKKSTRRHWKQDKGYLCAAFSKFQSCIVERDSFDLKCAQLQWDAAELGTRFCRMYIDSTQINLGSKIDNLNTMFMMTAVGIGEKMFHGLLYKIIKEVQVPRDQEMYLNYRRTIDDLLNQTAQYATTPEEATRLLKRKPIDPKFKQAEQIADDLHK